MKNPILNLNNILIDHTGWPMSFPLATEAKQKSKKAPHILLIDDDPLFCKKISRAAEQNRIPLSICSLNELNTLRDCSGYDVALVDYYLGDITAAEVIPAFKGKLPVVIISEIAGIDVASALWPQPVKRFVSKNKGVNQILKDTLKTINAGTPIVEAPIHSFFSLDQNMADLLWSIGIALFYFLCCALVFAAFNSLNPENSSSVTPSAPSHIQRFRLDTSPLNIPKSKIQWDQAPSQKTTDVG